VDRDAPHPAPRASGPEGMRAGRVRRTLEDMKGKCPEALVFQISQNPIFPRNPQAPRHVNASPVAELAVIPRLATSDKIIAQCRFKVGQR
jgi:hypothetical protein